MGFAGCDRRHGSPQGRGAPCASVGGYMRGEKEKKAAKGRSAGRPRAAAVRLGRFRVFRPRPAALGFPGGFCVAVSRFLAKPIQNGFCGIRPLAREPAGAWPALRVGRWVYEKALRGGSSGTSWAPPRGSLRRLCNVPIQNSPLSRGALRSAGVPTIAARTTAAPPTAPGLEPARFGGISEESRGAREYPDRAEGWALWVTGGSPRLRRSHRGYRRVGEAASGGRALPVGASSWGA